MENKPVSKSELLGIPVKWLLRRGIGFQIIIFTIYLFLIGFIIWLGNKHEKSLEKIVLYASVIPFIISIMEYIYQSIKMKKNIELYESLVLPMVEDFNKIILKHAKTSANINFRKAKDLLVSTTYELWRASESMKIIEFVLIQRYCIYLSESSDLDESDRMFLMYSIISHSYQSSFSQLVDTLKNGDYFKEGSPFNQLIKKIYLFINKKQYELRSDISTIKLEPQEIQDILLITFQIDNEVIKKILSDVREKENMLHLLNKCIENGYTDLKGINYNYVKAGDKFYMLFKYDERFTIFKKKWHSSITKYLNQRNITPNKIERAIKVLDDLITPQPFSKAIRQFDAFQPVGKDHFLYLVDPRKFPLGYNEWPIEKFVDKKIIPETKKHLDKLNKNIVKAFPYLKELLKTSLDTNYYLFSIHKKDFKIYASDETIPDAIRQLILNEAIDTPEVVASQLIYIKQVINNLTLSGLLFTESEEYQKNIRKIEKEILRNCEKNDLIINTIFDIANIGNKKDILIQAAYEAKFGKRKNKEKLRVARKMVAKLIDNASSISIMLNKINKLKGKKLDAQN